LSAAKTAGGGGYYFPDSLNTGITEAGFNSSTDNGNPSL
jgi:hypothetical protein